MDAECKKFFSFFSLFSSSPQTIGAAAEAAAAEWSHLFLLDFIVIRQTKLPLIFFLNGGSMSG